ncbi:hypothetical protein QRX50_31575 [Amycolatopsis carbonis]|uniref:Uncharacterized protein n=1 Tax=Amycolatopsis carbonis TaxID=715471 RepID=A0A9Y2MRY2_9PSEU|nr:hypothetical protein [Amycolatopsis sp. 2-15]WIX76001.1 hypothetical protein QRX50_31575 [Amycolatopsis sp. 2-15]
MMSTHEAARVMALLTAYDNRNAGEGSIFAWSEASRRAGWSFDEAIEAVHTHYAETRQFMMPADVTRIVRAHRAARSLPEWCGKCGSEWPDDRAAKNPRFRYHTNQETEERVMCICHPNNPQQKRLP